MLLFLIILTFLIVLCVTSGGVLIISFSSVIGVPAGIENASFNVQVYSNDRNS